MNHEPVRCGGRLFMRRMLKLLCFLDVMKVSVFCGICILRRADVEEHERRGEYNRCMQYASEIGTAQWRLFYAGAGES